MFWWDFDISWPEEKDGVNEEQGFAIFSEEDVLIVEVFDEDVVTGNIVVVISETVAAKSLSDRFFYLLSCRAQRLASIVPKCSCRLLLDYDGD